MSETSARLVCPWGREVREWPTPDDPETVRRNSAVRWVCGPAHDHLLENEGDFYEIGTTLAYEVDP